METEIEAVIKYFKNGGQLHYYGSEFKAAKIADLLPEYQYLYSGDAPDMFFKKDDLVIIIEHFEFDCYKATQKGSDFRRELARIQRNEEAIPSTEEGEVLRDVIHGSSSYEYYISNVTKAFKEHYAHIDLYIDNLRKSGAIDKNSHIKVLFFIEDVSPLGCVAVERTNSESELVLVTLAESREFLDLLRDNTRVDFVLACSSYSNEPYIWFIDRTELDAYYEQALDYHSMRFAEFTPRVRVFKKLITIDETGEINGTAKDIEYAYQWDNLTKCHDRGAFPVQALSAGESQIIKVAFDYSLSGTEKCTACFILRYRDLLENDYTQKLTFNFIRNSSKTLSLENLTTSSPEFTPKVATNV